MSDMTFADFITRERERLHAEREQLFMAQQEIESKIGAINNELRAIAAYESAKTAKATAPAGQARGRVMTTRRGSRREGLLTLLREHPVAGLSRGEILEQMGLKNDKSGAMSVSNALTALTKAGDVHRKDGKYRTVHMRG